MPISLTTRPNIPGGYSVSNETSIPIQYVYLSKQGAFDITVNGLLPSTLHYLFFEKQRVESSNFKPLNGSLGDPIYTDANGQASFTFYYNSPYLAASTEDVYIEYSQRLGGDKQLVLASSPANVLSLPDNYMSAFNSITTKTIFFKTSKISELPVSTVYSFSYPPVFVPPFIAPPVIDVSPEPGPSGAPYVGIDASASASGEVGDPGHGCGGGCGN